jgi:hypothetical protein
MALGELLTGLPNLQMQLARMLPGGPPGAPGNPNPSAAGGSPVAGGGNAAPSNASPQPGGAAAPQQQPMAYQSPPHLATQYQQLQDPMNLMTTMAQLEQRAQAADQINRGLATMVAGLSRVSPQERALMMRSGEGQVADPLGQMGEMMKVWSMSNQMTQQQALLSSLPRILQEQGLPADLAPFIASNPDLLSKVVETKYGVGGGAAWMAQLRAEKAYHDRGETPPWTEGDPTSFQAWNQANTAQKLGEAKDAQAMKDAGTTSFGKIMPTLNAAETNIEWLSDPAHRDAVVKAITTPLPTSGLTGKAAAATGVGGVDQDVLTARSKIDWLKKQLYADRFVGTKNVRSNTEANNLGAGATNVDTMTNDPETIGNELDRLKTDTYTAIANLHAQAGKTIPAKYAGLADPTYLNKTRPDGSPNPFYTGATEAPPSENPASKVVQAPTGGGGGDTAAPVPGAKRASDGNWYVPDPKRPGKYLRVD